MVADLLRPDDTIFGPQFPFYVHRFRHQEKDQILLESRAVGACRGDKAFDIDLVAAQGDEGQDRFVGFIRDMFGRRDIVLDLEGGGTLIDDFPRRGIQQAPDFLARRSFRIPARARGIEGSRLA
jgi:hypothetical protein